MSQHVPARTRQTHRSTLAELVQHCNTPRENVDVDIALKGLRLSIGCDSNSPSSKADDNIRSDFA